ncbi:MAG: metal-dependent hydrolase [Pseudomonadota bacterium]
MDSVSQAALGASVAVVVTQGQHPVRAILYGAALGTLPDLDVIAGYETDLLSTVKHRTWSHSWLVQTAIAPILAIVASRFDRLFSLTQWFLMVLLCFLTHSGLDAITIYGTDLFWPLSDRTVMGGSTFIIDPLLTLPMAVALIWVWRHQSSRRCMSVAALGLTLSMMYLVWGGWQKARLESIAEQQLRQHSEPYQRLVATPTPFNSILWRILVIADDAYYEGFYSLFDRTQAIRFRRFSRNIHLVDELPETEQWQMANVFQHGFNGLEIYQEQIIVNDLRMGIEPFYFFRFRLAENTDNEFHSVPADLVQKRFPDVTFFLWLARRIVNEEIKPIN